MDPSVIFNHIKNILGTATFLPLFQFIKILKFSASEVFLQLQQFILDNQNANDPLNLFLQGAFLELCVPSKPLEAFAFYQKSLKLNFLSATIRLGILARRYNFLPADLIFQLVKNEGSIEALFQYYKYTKDFDMLPEIAEKGHPLAKLLVILSEKSNEEARAEILKLILTNSLIFKPGKLLYLATTSFNDDPDFSFKLCEYLSSFNYPPSFRLLVEYYAGGHGCQKDSAKKNLNLNRE